MDRQERNELYTAAPQRLDSANYSPRKLALIHTGAILLISLLAAVLQYILNEQIGSTGGIGGLGTRAMLSTAQSALLIAQLVLITVWEIGFVYAMLKLYRQEQVALADLTQGFRMIMPVLIMNIVRSGIFMLIGLVSMYVGSMLFMATPFARPFMDQLLPLMENNALPQDPAALQELLTPVLEQNITPLICCMGIVFAALSLPLFYRYRMASYFLLDEPEKGAVSALRSSRKLMRFLCIDLFKLDLKFWLFYVLDLLVTAVCYGDVLLELMGIQLPFDATAAYFIFLIAYAVCQLALYTFLRPRVEITYAGAYCALRARFNPVKPDEQTP